MPMKIKFQDWDAYCLQSAESQRGGLWSPGALKVWPWSPEPKAFFNLEPRQK